MSIHPGTSFFDVVKHVQRTAAVLKNGLACLNRNESLFRVAAIPAEPQHFLLVVSLNHTIGNWAKPQVLLGVSWMFFFFGHPVESGTNKMSTPSKKNFSNRFSYKDVRM